MSNTYNGKNELDCLRIIASNATGGTGGGATIPDTTNLIAGDGAGNGADSGINPITLPRATGLPTWMFDGSDSSDPDPGCFTTNDPSLNGTSLIRLSLTDKIGMGISQWPILLPVDVLLYFGSQAGTGIGFYQASSVTDNADLSIDLVVGNYGSPAGNWSGIYGVTFGPNLSNILASGSVTPGNIAVFDSNFEIYRLLDSGVSPAVLAPLSSPAFTDTPTAPTATPLDNSGTLATTAYVDAACGVVNAAIGAAISAALSDPGTLAAIIAAAGLTTATGIPANATDGIVDVAT